MKQITIPIQLLLFSLIFAITGYTQNIDVKDFQVLPNDQTARVYHPIADQNGEKCALIKVVTNQTGFVWEGGALGITKVEKKTGEYWVYVPRGSKKLTIKHDKLGVLRDYIYPETLIKAMVYEMKLTTASVKTVVEKQDISSAYLVFKSTPEGADVFIDDKFRGKTPFSGRFKSGEHTYRLTKSKYHPQAGKVNILPEEGRKELNLSLSPNFGKLSVKSKPESGMQVFIDGESTGKNTPVTINKLLSGEHTVTLKSKWYQPLTRKIVIQDEKETELSVKLQPVFGKVFIKTNPSSDIYMNGEKIGYGSYEGRVIEGIHTFQAEKEKYTADKIEKEIISNKNVNINLNPQPKYGKLDISSDPIDAKIKINGKAYGKTPTVIGDLLIGTYNLKLEKEGYSLLERTFQINENQTKELKEKLASSKQVTISSSPPNAKLYMNGEFHGRTPLELNLSYKSHDIRLEKDNYQTFIDNLLIIDSKNEYNFTLKSHYNSVKIDSEPSGAKIYIDGESKGRTPKNINLKKGSSTLKLEKYRYITKERQIIINDRNNQYNYKLYPDSKYYTTKFEAMLLSAIYPGWGSWKINNNFYSGLMMLSGASGSYINILISLRHDFEKKAFTLHGALIAFDWLIILLIENKTNFASNIKPSIKLQQNPITMKNDLMVSLKFMF